MLVTTSAIHREELEVIKAKLQEHHVTYSAELSTLTRVLITKSSEGAKYRLAQEQGIPCVTPSWVFLGSCCMDMLTKFDVRRSLLGLEVCSTSLNPEERRNVQLICKASQATCKSSLTRRCALLVVPSEALNLARNEKVQFARKNRVDVLPYCQFLRKFGHSLETHSVPGPEACHVCCKTKSSVVVYCSPPDLVTDEVLALLERAGLQREVVLTSLTTHVVLLGRRKETFFPRPGLEFVSLAWLEQCAADQHGCVAADVYRVLNVQTPVITFTSVPQKERIALCNSLKEAGLPCIVQEDFILGGNFGTAAELYNTTHLVVGCSTLGKSSKVTALGWRMRKLRRRECFLVDLEWVRRSVRAGEWVDCSPFALEVLQPSAEKKALPKQSPAAIADSAEDTAVGISQRTNPAVRETSGEELHLNSLEILIGDLESKTGALGSGLTMRTPEGLTTTMTMTTRLQNTETVCPSSAEVPFSVLAAFLPARDACSALPLQSQVIVYKGGSIVHTEKAVMEQKQELNSVHLSMDVTYDSGHTEVAGVACETSNPKTISCERPCCIMMAKSLVQIEGVFARLQALGCKLATTVEDCTHYVTGKPSRTEFFLGAVSAGKWVLAPSFIEEMLSKGRIVPEEPHEWSPQIAKAAMLRNSMIELARACRLQRLRTVRPFSSWRTVLCCASDSRTKSFSHVLRNGGCCIIRPYSPLQLLDTVVSDPGVLHEFTIVLSDNDMWDTRQLETISARIPVLRMDYIAHCLCVEEPDPRHYKAFNGSHAQKRPRTP